MRPTQTAMKAVKRSKKSKKLSLGGRTGQNGGYTMVIP
jgi:hypothetical protein